ncbi:MAG: lamin tail domain-containing protein, partial [Marinoscillum sp.]
PGTQNSLYNLGPDNTQPEVVSFEVLDDQTIRFTFSEQMDSLSVARATVDGLVPRVRNVSGLNNEILTIDLLAPIAKEKTVDVSLSGAMDCSGNEMEPVNFTVGIGVAPAFNELIITEIMADPEPTIGLPASEYLEIYNTSDKLISLSGLTLEDASNIVSLPAVTLAAKDYLLLTPTSSVSSFSDTINAVGVSGWSTLSNGGEPLVITLGNELIFEIEYADDWYTDETDGGVSLEMKDVNNPCGGALNWGSSTASHGGTPGYRNANSEDVPDSFGPVLVSAEVLSPNNIVFIFNEPLSINADKNIAFVTEPVLDFAAVTFGNDRKSIHVELSSPLVANTPVMIKIFSVV